MSDINGKGHGDCHNWFRLGTHGRDSIHMECMTEYECIDCKAYFRHFYNRPFNDDIFNAMKAFGIKTECKK